MVLIYVNNIISKIYFYGKLFLFAEDTTIHVEGERWDDVYDKSACNEFLTLK